MFGYVQANTALLTPEQLTRYRGIYCGVCRSLRTRHSAVSGLVLSYDMVFLVLLLTSLRSDVESEHSCRCLPHPLKIHEELTLPYTDYAADLNLLLAYYNCLDDWQDDRSVPKLAAARLFQPEAEKIAARYPVQAAGIRDSLEKLSTLEKAGSGPDSTSACFGELMAVLFDVCPDAPYAQSVRRCAAALGRFVYLMDAVLDLKDDLKKCRFNPLTGLPGNDYLPLLQMLMGECTEQFESLPLRQDTELLRNILYSGVWAKYLQAKAKEQKENAPEKELNKEDHAE